MSTIRTFRPTDFVSLISFLRHDSHREVTAQLWPEVPEDPHTRMVWSLLSGLISRAGRVAVWVYMSRGAVRGLAVAQPRAGRLAWDVEDLLVAESDQQVGVGLLEHVAAEAARRGGRRVFLATPRDGDLARLASRAGFANYTSETLYLLRLTTPAANDSVPASRPRLRQDSLGLFQLYNAAVPCRVRIAEAMTMDEWASLDRGRRPWAPSLSGRHRHFVWEHQAALVGWLRLASGARSQHLSLLVHPSRVGETEGMVLHSLGRVNPRLPVYTTAREYQPELARALETRNFQRVSDHLVFARELAARVPGRVLIPARA